METDDVHTRRRRRRRKSRGRAKHRVRGRSYEVRSGAEGGKGALLARSIHTTGNPSASHAVPRPFRSPLTPYPLPPPPFHSEPPLPLRRFRCSRDRTRLIASRFLAPQKNNRLAHTRVSISFTVFLYPVRSLRSRPTLHSSSRELCSLSRERERGRVLFIPEQRRVGISGSVCSMKRFAFRDCVDEFHENVERVSEHWTRVNES